MDDLTSVLRNSPLDKFSDSNRNELIEYLNEDNDMRRRSGAIDPFQLLLVLYGVRPACIVGPGAEYVKSWEAAQVESMLPEEYFARDDSIGQFLERFDIPYAAYQSSGDHGDTDRFQISRNYYVSFGEERLSHLDHVLSESSRFGVPTNQQHIAIGQFLGFPEQAIEEWCESYEAGEDTLLDRLSDDEVLHGLSPFDEVVQTLDVNAREFAKSLLPYVVPISASECRTRLFHDLQQYLAVGIHALTEYDITLLWEVAEEHKVRHKEQ